MNKRFQTLQAQAALVGAELTEDGPRYLLRYRHGHLICQDLDEAACAVSSLRLIQEARLPMNDAQGHLRCTEGVKGDSKVNTTIIAQAHSVSQEGLQ